MDWTELLNQTLSIILPAAATLLATWFAVLGNKMKNAYNEKVNTETKKEVICTTVEYVQQLYKTLNGDEKLEKAIERATTILNEKGIKVSDTELRTLIESAVYGLKQGMSDKQIEEAK